MILCLDVGNSHIFGGVFVSETSTLQFRYATRSVTSDELGIFLRAVLRENELDYQQINQVGICSVVPYLDYSLRSACKKYLAIEPFFIQAGVKTGLKIKYRNPLEVGADRVVNAIAATHLYPQQDVIVIDFGTATTFCVVTAAKEYLGGAIVPGLHMSMKALQAQTAKLPSVEIVKTQQAIGRSTIESIQVGLYLSAMGTIREVIQRIQQNLFAGRTVAVVATGGFAHLFAEEQAFSAIVPDLVLQGIRVALQLNEP